ncbi:exopolyphosphatase [Blastomyces gilchristii SLH14081]|uniref:Exopolyphosphatase n=1 Tax=Blastomyces gilchristii (strain SLH14081) TaxID=559298 RepID=A0A179UA58_BLAGS|nr:exopolyphosphatase [Blastomyces gilchristii SLH14081]OAT04886.1 exopolyphosphatase [Blastomyces gilchristii SLH14081]
MGKPATFTRRLDLLRFLKQAHNSSHFSPNASSSSLPITPAKYQIYVLGNPSADLDSILSAIVYSYFATRVVSSSPGTVLSSPRREGGQKILRQYIPLIDLPDVHSGKELARLRPEFVTALRLAVGWDGSEDRGEEEADTSVLENSVLTVADLKEQLLLSLGGNPTDASGENEAQGAGDRHYHEAAPGNINSVAEELKTLNVMLVDWNALPKLPSNGGKRGIEGLSDAVPELNLSVVGCIDHHDDECFVSREPESYLHDPRCIQTGVGSCMSLVVRELRAQGLWADPVPFSAHPHTALDPETAQDQTVIYEAQAAKLAMAAILIDTANMTAKSKVSSVDTAAVTFLEAKIRAGTDGHLRSNPQSATSGTCWDRQAFYDAIALAKENSVENLTVLEVLGRDYKEWAETIATTTGSPVINNNKTVKLGICCIVKPLSWLMEKCAREYETPATTPTNDTSSTALLSEYLSSFAGEKHLDLVAVMTAFRSPEPESEFRRELLLYNLNRDCRDGLKRFEAAAIGELGLEAGIWIQHVASPDTGDDTGRCMWIWRQTDVSKSRKQVAPLLRRTFCDAVI